ncbi:hypothetical protein, partial [Enterococcus hirae]|uniref:hypothetical protein n=1 Tax=Enterococcus hirae TaxID=1354 RepID=UPI001A92F388
FYHYDGTRCSFRVIPSNDISFGTTDKNITKKAAQDWGICRVLLFSILVIFSMMSTICSRNYTN